MGLLKERSIKTLLNDLKNWFALKAEAVFSVNGNTPVDGEVTFDTIPYADNLTSDDTQHTEGSFTIRVTGGDISLSDGDSYVQRIMGNRIHEGYVAEVITPSVIAMPRPTPAAITAALNEATFEAYVGEAGTYTLTYDDGEWSADPALYGVTITNDPVDGDQIVIVWDGENDAEMTVNAVEREADPEITITIDRDVFVAYVSASTTILLTYTTAWSADPALYGITVSNTPLAGDQISVVYVKEDRGTITQAAPTALVATGWNLYNNLTGYAYVPKYSDTYGYRIGGSYTGIEFAETPEGDKQEITVTNGLFNVPSDGYIIVTGGDSTTYIYTTWSDWQEGYQGDFESYTESALDLTAVMNARFPHGLMRVGDVRDEINLNTGKTISRIERMLYTAENIAALGSRQYEADTTYIYAVRQAEVVNNISLEEKLTISEHGTEFFRDTEVETYAEVLYGTNLKDKLRRQVVTIASQTFTSSQQAQARSNIGAGSAVDVASQKTAIGKILPIITGTTNNSGYAIAVGQYFEANGELYKATAAIANDNTVTWSGKATAMSSNTAVNALKGEVDSLNSNLTNVSTTATRASTALPNSIYFTPGRSINISFKIYTGAALIFGAVGNARPFLYIFSNGYLAPVITADTITATLSADYKTITMSNNGSSYGQLGVICIPPLTATLI